MEELFWLKKNPAAEVLKWRAPSWCWASLDGRIDYSTMSGIHARHPGLLMEAELVDRTVKARPSGELDEVSMRMKCKLLYALSTKASAAGHSNSSRDHRLELFDDERDSTNSPLSSRVANLDVLYTHDIDDGGASKPEYGYVMVLQRCVHARAPEFHGVIEESVADGQSELQINEKDYLEALFLKPSDESRQRFKRAGFICSYDFRAVHGILEAHHSAEERVVTLI